MSKKEIAALGKGCRMEHMEEGTGAKGEVMGKKGGVGHNEG